MPSTPGQCAWSSKAQSLNDFDAMQLPICWSHDHHRVRPLRKSAHMAPRKMNDRWMRGQLLPGTWFTVNPDFASQRHSICQRATDVSTPSFESDATLAHAIGLTTHRSKQPPGTLIHHRGQPGQHPEHDCETGIAEQGPAVGLPKLPSTAIFRQRGRCKCIDFRDSSGPSGAIVVTCSTPELH
jgi:hypothetical protein